MSLKTVEDVQKNRIFKVWDILVYAVLLLAIGAMFFVMLFKNNTAGELNGVEITYQGEKAALFTFEERKLTEYSVKGITFAVSEQEDGTVRILIHTAKKDGTNILVVEPVKKRARMLDADCSSKKDCTTMKLDRPTDSIICIPHALVITASTKGFVDPGGIQI